MLWQKKIVHQAKGNWNYQVWDMQTATLKIKLITKKEVLLFQEKNEDRFLNHNIYDCEKKLILVRRSFFCIVDILSWSLHPQGLPRPTKGKWKELSQGQSKGSAEACGNSQVQRKLRGLQKRNRWGREALEEEFPYVWRWTQSPEGW